LRSFASEVTRVAREVGTEGKLGGQSLVPGVAGTWKDLTDSVNAMCGNLPAEPPFGADFTRHARNLAGKAVELVDHRVDGFLELEDFT
ncbi:hypothetical protein ACC709_36525, partial [Rhizobium ruizarguesonis]